MTYLNEFITLDKASLIVLGGRMKTGKSIIALNIVNDVAVNKRVPFLYFNLESTKENLIKKILSSNSKNDNENLDNSNNDSMKSLEQSKMYVDDTKNISIDEICRIARQYKNEKGIKIIVIDVLQFITYDKKQMLSRDDEISNIIIKLKELSKELNISVFVTSQLTNVENDIPTINDFHESKAIMENANIIMILYKDEQDNVKINVAKNDYGECKEISL